jgi:signal transduction histidine kinase
VRLARDRAAAQELGTRPGSGLGLAVVRDLVALLGGTTSVEDVPAPRRGARFVVALPLGEARGQGAEGREAADCALCPLPTDLEVPPSALEVS